MQIATGRADIDPRRDVFEDSNPVGRRARFGSLDNGDPVGARGHRSSRHDLDRLARADRADRCSKGRKVLGGAHILREDETERSVEVDFHGVEERAGGEHDALDVFEGDQHLIVLSVHHAPFGETSRSATIYLALAK